MKKGGTIAMDERKGFICWIKEHRKALTIAGIRIGTLILIVLCIRNREMVKVVWDSLRKAVKQPTAKAADGTVEISLQPIREVITAVASNSEPLPFEVSRHIRNLLEGWHASPEKIAEVLKNNIILMNGVSVFYRQGEPTRFFNGKENEQFPGKLEEIHCDTDNIKLEFLQRYGWLTDDYDVRVYSAKFKPKR